MKPQPSDLIVCTDCLCVVDNNAHTRAAARFDDHSSANCWVVPASLCNQCRNGGPR